MHAADLRPRCRYYFLRIEETRRKVVEHITRTRYLFNEITKARTARINALDLVAEGEKRHFNCNKIICLSREDGIRAGWRNFNDATATQ